MGSHRWLKWVAFEYFGYTKSWIVIQRLSLYMFEEEEYQLLTRYITMANWTYQFLHPLKNASQHTCSKHSTPHLGNQYTRKWLPFLLIMIVFKSFTQNKWKQHLWIKQCGRNLRLVTNVCYLMETFITSIGGWLLAFIHCIHFCRCLSWWREM